MTRPHFTIRRLMMTVLGSGLILGLAAPVRSFLHDGDWMVLSPLYLGAIATFGLASIALAVIFLFQLARYGGLPVSSESPEPE